MSTSTQLSDKNVEARMSARASRRAVLKGAVAGGAALALGGIFSGKALAESSESLATIVNIALTAEHLAVTVYSNAIPAVKALGIDDDPANLAYLQGALAAEADHVHILQLLGGTPLTTSFSLPGGAKTFTDKDTFTSTLIALETAFVAAYLAAVQEAASAGRPDIAQLTARHAAVEAEHRVNARNIANLQPSNNSSFEALLFTKVGDAATALGDLGFLSPVAGNTFSYPGPVAPDFTGMIDRHP